MSRKATRRAERAVSLRRRILAGATSVIMGLGLAVGGLTPAMANNGNGQGGGSGGQGGGSNPPCDSPAFDYDKPDVLDDLNENVPGTATFDWGTISWDGKDVEWTINPGYEVDLCVKGGNTGDPHEITELTSNSDQVDYVHSHGVSHLGFKFRFDDDWRYAAPTCDGITIVFPENLPAGQQGVIDVNVEFGSGEKYNYKLEAPHYSTVYPDGHAGETVTLTWSQFRDYVAPTGAYSVVWIQVHGTNYHWEGSILCGELPDLNLFEPKAEFEQLGCTSDGEYTLDDVVIDGDRAVQWYVFVGETKPTELSGYTQVGPGTVIVDSEQIVHVKAMPISEEFGLEPGVTSEWTFEFERPTDCPVPVCIPDEYISYTYIRTGPDANTGIVTVTQPAGDAFSDQLCKPLFVTAAAWAYDYIDLKWTQTLVATKEINDGEPITTVGTYEYGVPVGCGQGDIYASRDEFPRPSPFLLGPNQPDWGDETPWTFNEVFLSDKKKFKFDGPSPTWVQTNPGCNGVEPVTPMVTAIDECGTYGSLAVSPSPFISYIVKDENGDVVATVEYDENLEQVVVPGATEGQFTVTPVAHFPYLLQNYDANDEQWSVNLGEYRECPGFSVATNIAEECDRDAPWITYSVEVTDPDGQLAGSNARLIFVDPNGIEPNHIVELGTVTVGELLEGRVLWPGASVDGDGNPTGWPGWELNASDEWVETDSNFRWTRDITEVTLEVNPSMQLPLAYPVSTLDCAADPRELEPEPVITTGNCFDPENSYALADIPGIQWFVDGNPVDPDTYVLAPSDYDSDGNVTVVITVEIDESAAGGPYGFAEGATTSWSESFSEVTDEECVLPLTDVTLAFTEATCLEPQGLDVPKFEFDRDLAELDDVNVDSDGDYTVVFTTIGDKTTFDQSDDVAVDGRTVSLDGKTLTFVGTLDGPNDELCTVLEVVDPFDFVDNCLTASYTLYYVEGLTYLVTVNDNEPVEVVFGENETEKTFVANPGDYVLATPTADPGYVLSPDQPAPLDRTFATYPDGCQLPEFPNWPASASATDEVCTPFGVTSGYITVELSTGPDTNPNPVRYYIAHETAEEQELTTAKTTVPAGNYVVTAVLEDPADSINDSGNEPVNFPLTVGAADESDCDLPTLAITGASNAVTGVGIGAVIIILAGLGFVLRRQLTA